MSKEDFHIRQLKEDQNFYCNVAWLRKNHGLSKKEMAKRLHIGVKTLDSLEHGEMPPRLSSAVFFHIHKSFGIPPTILFGCRLEDPQKQE